VSTTDRLGHGTRAMLELRQVSKAFGAGRRKVQAVDDIDLTIGEREVVALLGPSGCGKTTLLRMLAGLAAPTSGTLHLDGASIWRGAAPEPSALAAVTMVFQEANLLPWASIEDNVALPLRLKGVARRQRRERARSLCQVTGIGGFERHRPHQLSVGMRQRAALARALIVAPRLLLLDEPFAALDAMTRDAMNEELQRLWSISPCAAVLVTHSIAEAVLLADRVVILSPRPARVVDVVHVPFGRPRPISLEQTVDFQDLVGTLRAKLAAA
jgi:NitT/TauT family transport system ATP-binding protein